jgi:hypothetical protein
MRTATLEKDGFEPHHSHRDGHCYGGKQDHDCCGCDHSINKRLDDMNRRLELIQQHLGTFVVDIARLKKRTGLT